LNLVVCHHFSNISSYLNLSVHIQCILWWRFSWYCDLCVYFNHL